MTKIATPQIPANWAWSTIGEVVQNRVDQSGPDSSEHFLYVDISSIDTSSKKITEPKTMLASEAPSRARQRIKPGDVLVSMTRPNLNAVAIVSDDFAKAIGSTGFDVLRAQNIEPRWLFFLAQTTAFVESMSMLVQGALYPAVRPKDIRGYRVPIAPIQEQRRIVPEIEKQFTRLDAAVVALKRVQANLKRYRAAVLKAACEGRLVPTEAELARRDGRAYEPSSVLLERILAERRSRWEAAQVAKFLPSGNQPSDNWKAKYPDPETPDIGKLPPLPQGWTWATLSQLSQIQGGIQKQPSRKPIQNRHPFLRVANVLRGRLDLSEVHEIELFKGELEKLRLEAGDLLIVEGNGSPSEIGRMAIWKGEIENCVHQNHIIRSRLLGAIPPAYVAAYWNSSTGASSVLNVASSTSGLYTLSVNKVGRIPVPLPPLAEQGRIVAEVERRLSVIDELDFQVEANVKRAERLRQSVLKSAYEGKLAPQDPSDEPASALLERIRADREAVAKTPTPGRRLRKKETTSVA